MGVEGLSMDVPWLLRGKCWSLLCVALAAVLITLGFWMVSPHFVPGGIGTDYAAYYRPVAESILEGRGIVHPDGTPATANPPGYSLLLAGLFALSEWWGVSRDVLLAAVALMSVAGSSSIVFALGRSVYDPLRAAMAALIWMTYPFALLLTTYPNSELVFLPLFYGSILVLVRALSNEISDWLPYFSSGLLIGATMLVRAIAVGGGLVLGAAVWFSTRGKQTSLRLFLVGMILLGNLVAVVPWESWLYLKSGEFVVLGTNSVPSIRDGLTFAIVSKGYRSTIPVPPDVAGLMRDVVALARAGRLESVGTILSFLKGEIVARPFTVIKLFVIKAFRSWYASDSGRFEKLMLLIQSIYLILAVWGTQLAWKEGQRARVLVIVIWLLGLYFWIMTIVVLSILRYMVPAMGLLCLLIPLGVGDVRKRLKFACPGSGQTGLG
jgi:hypothetical protein